MTEPVEQYQERTEALAAGTVAEVAAVWAAVQAAQINTVEAGVMIAAAIAVANAAATSLADAYVSAAIEEVAGVPAPAVGLPPVDDLDRLAQAVATVVDDPPQATDRPASRTGVEGFVPTATDDGTEPADVDDKPEPIDAVAVRLERLARSEPLATAQRATVEAIAAQPKVIGWRRRMDSDPCELCQFWYAGGRVYKPTTEFRQHPGCNCQPEPVIKTKEKQPA